MTMITAQFVHFIGKGKTFAMVRYENGPNLTEVKVSVGKGCEFDPMIKQGEWIAVDGYWRKNTWNGKDEQIFNARSIHPTLPITRKGVSQLLMHAFTLADHGVDAKRIAAYVEKHGPAGAIKAEKYPDILLELTDDKAKFKDRIQRDWARIISNREANRILEAAKVKPHVIKAILDVYKTTTIDVLKRNPYELVSIPGIPFETIDTLGKSVGIKFDDPRRVRAVLSHLVIAGMGDGHTYVPYDSLKDEFRRLQVTGASLAPVLNDLTKTDIIVRKDTMGNLLVQKKNLVDAEQLIAKLVARILARRDTIDRDYVDKVTDQVLAQEKYAHIRKDPSQVEAVRRSVREPIAVLTGGPGTGKSTVTEAIAEIVCIIIRGKLFLAAPAGKAARRQEEATKYKYKAKTVHSLLESKGKTGNNFGRNRDKPLDAGCFVVIDESSMLDIETAAALLDALPPDGRILFVGDEAQLQSVGAGNFFGDLMKALAANGNHIPVSRLEKVHRNAAESKIAHYAREIREGTFSSAKLDKKLRPDVAFIECPNGDIADKIVALASSGSRKHLGLDPKKDVIVLCPMKDGACGTRQLNAALSLANNKYGASITGFSRISGEHKDEPLPRVGDRVMLTENDGDNDVSNGDVGTIVSAGPDEHNGGKMAVWVEFDSGQTVAFNLSEAQRLILAYAITGHKSQGSQYPFVLMPMTMDHKNMLGKNLVYTEWTRAKSFLMMVGDKAALDYGVNNITSAQRRTRLKEFLEIELANIPAIAADKPRPAPPEYRVAQTASPGRRFSLGPSVQRPAAEEKPIAEAIQAAPRRFFNRRPPPSAAPENDESHLPRP